MLFTVLVISSFDTTKSEVTFLKYPGPTCAVLGGEAHLAWEYEDGNNTVDIIRLYNGTIADSAMGTYETASETFTLFERYEAKINFSLNSSGGNKFANLAIVNLQSTDTGKYTVSLQATPDRDDFAILEVVAPEDLGRREFCVDALCYQQWNGSVTLHESGNVTFQYTKAGCMSCDIFIDVVASTGVICHQVQADNVAKCLLGDSATFVDTEFINITYYGKNGRPFYTEAFSIKFLTSSSTVPNAVTSGSTVRAFWKDLAISFATLLTIVLVSSVFVYVVCWWYRGKREKPKEDAGYTEVPAADHSACEMPLENMGTHIRQGDDQPPNHCLQTVKVEHLSNVNGHRGAHEEPDSGVGPSSANTT